MSMPWPRKGLISSWLFVGWIFCGLLMDIEASGKRLMKSVILM
uniref:Uncharacterized protein n=1 Tax=Picea glauca TaxID=3330 RepID=A0A101M4Z8_PICGL|nr:hypothetical protein ABT39_MTgene2707 [Picea glauca]KUM46069.1 hypothetical protein ABT39_MTgene1875 [Picea glauca]KUM51044.1 hypothetical protein ABT39_MTgene890 [Picea glauca]